MKIRDLTNKLYEITKIIYLVLFIILGIKLIIFLFIPSYKFNILFKIFSVNVSDITNVILAICAVCALGTWRNEINYKRKFDVIDEILKLVIEVNYFLGVPLYRDAAGLPIDPNYVSQNNNSNLDDIKVRNEMYIQEHVKDFNLRFQFLYSKYKTINDNNLVDDFDYIISNLTEYLEKGVTFYQEVVSYNNNLLSEIKKHLQSMKEICENYTKN